MFSCGPLAVIMYLLPDAIYKKTWKVQISLLFRMIPIAAAPETPVAMERVVEAVAIVAMDPRTVEMAVCPIAMLLPSAASMQKLQVKYVH
jgi:hypothetical protein